MGFWATVKDAFEEIYKFIEAALEWLYNGENQDSVKKVLQIILTIIQAVSALNDPVPNRDRPKMVRSIIEVLQRMSPTDLRKLAETKELTNFDSMDSSKLDFLVGAATGGWVAHRAEVLKREGGRKPV